MFFFFLEILQWQLFFLFIIVWVFLMYHVFAVLAFCYTTCAASGALIMRLFMGVNPSWFLTDITSCHLQRNKTSSPKGNDAHLRAIIQSEKKWKHQFFRRLRAASSVVRGRIWPNFKVIEALMYVIITCKYEKDPITNNREKVATPFFKL